MSKKLKKIFASLDLAKTEELDDGTIKVWGYASADTKDSDGEIITADAMKAALPGYMKWGAVREMHQAKAAGTAIEAEVQDDGKTWFGAHIVDSEAVKKVQTGVYKGFSIGGKVTERDELNKSVIKGLNLIEVSLVDRPANPDAVLTMYKAEALDDDQPNGDGVSAVDQIAELLNKGEVSPEHLLQAAQSIAALKPAEGSAIGVAEVPAEDATKADEPTGNDTIKKGMWGVSRLADLLQSIAWLAEDTKWEADYEGDNSPLPQQLRDWLAAGANILKAMAEEEINELLASLNKAAGVDDLAKVAGTDIAKAGAKFSKATKGALAAIHKAAKDACDHLEKLGYEAAEEAEDEADKVAKAEQLSKAADGLKAIGETLQKAGVVKEGDLLIDGINKVLSERDNLQKRVAELEAKPAPGKALLKAITKAADVVGSDDPKESVDPVRVGGEINEAATLIKAIHAGKVS